MPEPSPGVRTSIGLIIPSRNRLTEPQFHRYCPPGVEPHVTRLRLTGPSARPPLEMLPEIRRAAEFLADAKCDIIVLHCTASAMGHGVAAEREVVRAIAEETNRPATSTASALLVAFGALGVRRLVLVSPYHQQTNNHEIAFLAEAGLEVVRDRALGLPGSDGYVNAPASVFLEATMEAADPWAEAYFLSCTNIRSPEVVQELEACLDRPVVTSNQATLWYCLRTCGVDDDVPSLGRLFQLGLPVGVAAR
jgi:maleate cis-trans isomerase